MSEVRVDNITGETGTDAVKFTKGINVTGIATVGNVSVGSSVTAATLFGNGAGLTDVVAGKLLRKSYYTITRQAISPASFPDDDTAPQITEGTEFFSQSYTPSTANFYLYIFCSANVFERTNVADDTGMALFISDNTSALKVVTDYISGDQNVVHGSFCIIAHKMPSWGVSAKTLSLRASEGNAINYAAWGYANAWFGAATHASLFIIEEIST